MTQSFQLVSPTGISAAFLSIDSKNDPDFVVDICLKMEAEIPLE